VVLFSTVFVCLSLCQHDNSWTVHRLRGSGSTVVTMTGKVNGKRKFWPPVDLKPLKILKPNLDWMIMSPTPTTVPIFVEIGPKGSGPQIREIQPTWYLVYLSFPFYCFLLFFIHFIYSNKSRAVAGKPCKAVQISIGKASGELHTEDIAIDRENSHFRWPLSHLTSSHQRTPTNIGIRLISQETIESIDRPWATSLLLTVIRISM